VGIPVLTDKVDIAQRAHRICWRAWPMSPPAAFPPTRAQDEIFSAPRIFSLDYARRDALLSA